MNLRILERPAVLALILAPILAFMFSQADTSALHADWLSGRLPYGVLWVLVNPGYWNSWWPVWVLYLIAMQTLLNWFLVKSGRLSKAWFFYGWAVSDFWVASGAWQNVSVTLLAPLSSLFPPLVLFAVLQKLPLGYWPPFSNAHWLCAFDGTQPYSDLRTVGLQCTSPAVRWSPAYPYLWEYVTLAAVVLLPIAVWAFRRLRGIRPR